MNKVILVGNLTRDPELTTTNSGVSVCRFSIAVQRRYNSEGGPQADFFNIVVWRNQAENCSKFLKKGSKCGVVGRLQNSSYEASDGTKRYATDIVADEVEFLNSKNSDGSDGASSPRPSGSSSQTELEPIDDDSLPF